MASILDKIIQHKYQEVAAGKQQYSLADLEQKIETLAPCRTFTKSLQDKVNQQQNAVIAEIKKASPSKGVIREDFDAESIAKSYEQGGATCLSVLTDVNFFQGSSLFLKQARDAVSIPVIRKDFIVDPWQVYESKVMNADCILLIVAALSESQLIELNQVAQALSIDVLVEVHSVEELMLAESINAPLIGINNRNLHDFSISLDTSIELALKCQTDALIISESGIYNANDIQYLNDAGIYSFLIGEYFMRTDEPGDTLRQLLT